MGFSRFTRTIRRAKQVWAELDDAQRRLLEMQSGQSLRRDDRPTRAVTVDELETLYSHEDPNLIPH